MSDVTPFRAAVPQTALDDLAERLTRTRLPEPETDRTQGPSREGISALHAYWRDTYDWRQCEARLNAFNQFLVEIDGVKIHFLHVRSQNPNATPLLLAHGWPGSILEFLDCVGPLTDPEAFGASGAPAFHVVIPSMPGFGFSAKPHDAGWNIGRIAKAYAELMSALGYDRWVCQGGDLGSAVAEAIGHMKLPGCVGLHLNLSFVQPTPDEIQNADDVERQYLGKAKTFFDEQMGYFAVQSTRPQTIAYSLADSPIGQASWIYDKFIDAVDYRGSSLTDVLSFDKMLDNITLYWLTNTGSSSAKLYWELKRTMPPHAPPAIALPTAYSGFAGETILASRRWLEKRFSKLVYYNLVPNGGHFAALEQPGLFVEELRTSLPVLLQAG